MTVPRQCKDIPDVPVLEFLLRHKGVWCNWYFGDSRDVHAAMPAGTPEKLVLGKMRMLIRRGLVTGCNCGCRGDFEITSKGEALLESQRSLQECSGPRSVPEATEEKRSGQS